MAPFIDTSPGRDTPRIVVHGSTAVELEWALATAGRPDYREDHPALAAVFERRPDLVERVCSFWDPESAVSCAGFMELVVLAHHGGLLLSTDAGALLGRIEELCATAPADLQHLALVSETDGDRRAMLRRLERLRRSARLRRAYAALMADLWEAVRGTWEAHGAAAVDLAVASRREALARGADWHTVAQGDCDFGDLLHRTTDALGAGGTVAVVPAYFTHRGLLLDLPGMVVVGVRASATAADARVRTEGLARRLKTIADPTRLAMLDTLRKGPLTVTELAAAFALAQPTVSNHVKLLREAGLVSDQRSGTRRRLVVQEEAAEALLAGLHAVLTAPRPGASGGGPGP